VTSTLECRMPSQRWTTPEDDTLAHHWWQQSPSWIAREVTRRFAYRRTTRAVVERARKLKLPPPGQTTKTLSQLAETTGYSRSRLRTAMERLGIRPRRVGRKRGWYGVTRAQEQRIVAYLSDIPDGRRLRRAVVGQWGGIGNRGHKKPAACIDCGTTERPHFCRGRCRHCDRRWRARRSVAT
jgi:hypothetical protein